MTNMLEGDLNFVVVVFFHNLSEYKSKEDLPKPNHDPDVLPDDVDKWL